MAQQQQSMRPSYVMAVQIQHSGATNKSGKSEKPDFAALNAERDRQAALNHGGGLGLRGWK